MPRACEVRRCDNPRGGTQCAACPTISCMEHSPAPGKFCNACELRFYDIRDSSKSYKTWRAIGFLIPWGVFLLLAYPVLTTFGFINASTSGTNIRGFSTGVPLLDMAIFAGLFSAIMCGGFSSFVAGRIRKEMIR